METYIGFLRGINVSGQKLIKMAEFKILLEENLPLSNVKTYIQSGNIKFSSHLDETSSSKLLVDFIKKAYGFDVPVLVRTPGYFAKVLNENPFLSKYPNETDRQYLVFLTNMPDQHRLDLLSEIDHSPEEFIVGDRVIYFFSPNGLGKAKMSNNFFERQLKVTATTRNLRTVETMLEI